MTEDKEQIVQTTVRMPRSLKARLDTAIFNSKQSGQKASIDGTIQQALEMLLTCNTPEVTCPICSSVLKPSPSGTEVVSTPQPASKFEIPEGSRLLVQAFVEFIADPRGDEHIRDFMLKVLGKRP